MKFLRPPGPLRRLALACQIYLGRPAWAAAILAITAIGLLVHWLPQMRMQRDLLRDAQRDREVTLRSLMSETGPGTASPPAALTPLLPLPAQHHDDIGTLLQMARRNGLAWEQADFSMELGGTFGAPSNVLRLRLNLPVKGSALQVSRFLGGALNALPHASLESLELESDDAASPARAARMRIVLLYRGAQP